MKSIKIFFLFFSAFCFSQKILLENKISAITKGKNATVAVSVKGIGFSFEFNNENSTKKLPLLSVFKFHIALATLDLVDRGKLSLNQKIFIKKEDLHEDTWSPLREKYPNGNFEITLAELLKYMVAQSDNNVTDLILSKIGIETVKNFADKKGIKNFRIEVNESQMHTDDWKMMYKNNSTTESLVDALIKLKRGKLLSRKSTDFMLKMMSETTTGKNKIVDQLPKGTFVAHKTGSSGKIESGLTIAENDIAIIKLPNRQYYVIAVLVSDSMESAEVNCKMIANISKNVWDYFVNR